MAEDKAKELKRLNGISEFSFLHGVELTPRSEGSMFAIHPSNPVRSLLTEYFQRRKTNFKISVHSIQAQTGTGRQGYGTPQSRERPTGTRSLLPQGFQGLQRVFWN